MPSAPVHIVDYMRFYGYTGLYYHFVDTGEYASSVDAAGGVVLAESCEGPFAAYAVCLYMELTFGSVLGW